MVAVVLELRRRRRVKRVVLGWCLVFKARDARSFFLIGGGGGVVLEVRLRPRVPFV